MGRRLIAASTKKALETVFQKLDKNAYWGKGQPRTDSTIRPFTINFTDQAITDLKSRLQNTRQLTPPLEGVKQEYGFNTNTLQEIIHHWQNHYNFKQRENFLNTLPQYQTEIQGLKLHFIHSKPEDPKIPTVPLLLLHGWPGSVREFYDIIPLLNKQHESSNFAFEVIAPSLPGYGFSEGASKVGLGAPQIAVVLRNLMKRLGHEEFYVQGGDWGSIIGRDMATIFPENVLGLHVNLADVGLKKTFLKLILGKHLPESVFPMKLKEKLYPLTKRLEGFWLEFGYFHLQATKPDTLGVAIGDSPAGMAAYILEKFSTGTNPMYRFVDGAGLLEKFNYDDLLDNIMFYWIPNNFTTAIRLYAENTSKKVGRLGLNKIPIDPSVPCAIARFNYEILLLPDFILKDKYSNIIQSSDFDRGGHFAAFEEPQLLAEDIFSAITKMEKLPKKLTSSL